MRANAKGTIPIAVKRQFYNPNYNPKVEFTIKIKEFLYKNAKKNTTLFAISCIKVVFWWAEVVSLLWRERRRADKLTEEMRLWTLLARPTVKAVVRATTYIPQNSTSFEVLFCGGQRWIRTTEVEDVRFTV